jgi:hypothetical protein
MKALRQQVERAVRPVRSSQRTKDRMRAELLEHLESLYNQELARSGDEAAALDAATRRFGDTSELTGELQASVPQLEQWAFLSLPGSRWSQRRREEAIGAWILRTTTAGSLASGVGLTLVVAALAGFENKLNRLAPVAVFLLAVLVLMWFSLVSMFWCCELLRREVERDDQHVTRIIRRIRIVALVLLSICSSAVAPVILVVMIRMTSPHPLFSTGEALLGCVGWVLLMGVLLPIQVRDWIIADRRFESWDSLDLEADLF